MSLLVKTQDRRSIYLTRLARDDRDGSPIAGLIDGCQRRGMPQTA